MLSSVENTRLQLDYQNDFVITSIGEAVGHIEKGECRRNGTYYTGYAYQGSGAAEMKTFERVEEAQAFVKQNWTAL